MRKAAGSVLLPSSVNVSSEYTPASMARALNNFGNNNDLHQASAGRSFYIQTNADIENFRNRQQDLERSLLEKKLDADANGGPDGYRNNANKSVLIKMANPAPVEMKNTSTLITNETLNDLLELPKSANSRTTENTVAMARQDSDVVMASPAPV